MFCEVFGALPPTTVPREDVQQNLLEMTVDGEAIVLAQLMAATWTRVYLRIEGAREAGLNKRAHLRGLCILCIPY